MSTDTTTICRDTFATTVYDGPYADLRDRRLAARLAAEDVAEEAGLDPFERISCRLHQRWLHQCARRRAGRLDPAQVVRAVRT